MSRSGFIGFKGCAGGPLSRRLNLGAQPQSAVDTGGLDFGRGRRNSSCSGEMHRYDEEHRLRRQPTRPTMTLRHESAGIEQD